MEVTVDVNSASIILVLRRFIARQGMPRLLARDNFKSFRSLDVVNKEYPGNLFQSVHLSVADFTRD